MPFPFHVKEHVVASQHIRDWPNATANSQEDVLYVAVKQYIPIDNPNPQPGDVTIIGAHANGFPKELYEALWEDLHAAAPAHGFRIRGIWIMDISNQGASGVINEHTQGNDPSWNDAPRDLLHLTNVFRAEMPRPIVGIAHSFGANILTHLSLLHPRLLTTMVLFDATIIQFNGRGVGPGVAPNRGSAFRRDLWPDRETAVASFRRSPFFKSWDPRVLDAWIKYGIRETPSALYPDAKDAGKVTLATSKHQEVFTFFRPMWPDMLPDGTMDRQLAPDFDPAVHDEPTPNPRFPFYRSEGAAVLARLPNVRPSVLWVFGGDSDLSRPEGRRHKMEVTGTGPSGSGGAKAGRVAEVVLEGRGHLFPMESPGVCATHAATWIGKEMKRWREGEKRYTEWTKLPTRDKITMSSELLEKVGSPKRPAATKQAKL